MEVTKKRLANFDALLTFWRPAQYTYLADLRTALDNCGYDQFTPNPRTPDAALKDALEEYFPTKDHRVEYLSASSSFEVVKITRGEEANNYQQLFRFAIDKAGQVSMTPRDDTVGLAVIEKYNEHRLLVRATAVTTALKGIASTLKATSPHDGVWWLPHEAAEPWKNAATEIELCATKGRKTAVYVFNHDIGPDELRAVVDAITRETEQAMTAIRHDVFETELGERALKNRRDEAEALRKKIAFYSKTTGANLDRLKEMATLTDEAAVAAEVIMSGELTVA
jgi:hypothetical protein